MTRVNKPKHTAKLEKLASDMKRLLQLDECQPVITPGAAFWLRMRRDSISLDVPVGRKPLLDPKHSNVPAIQQAIISTWIAHLERLMTEVVDG